LIADSDVTAYERDGVVCLRRQFDTHWIERLRGAIGRDLAAPGPNTTNFAEGSSAGKFFGDMFMWKDDPDFHAAALESPAPAIAARLMRSGSADFFYDQLFVKEPGTAHPTPWHQDQPYWPVKGWQITSVWIALDTIDGANGAVEFIAGSHNGA
jgi:ectoine hydroxylase-related dioxygenase (phytanoyl-CoA dioxygenase family)